MWGARNLAFRGSRIHSSFAPSLCWVHGSVIPCWNWLLLTPQTCACWSSLAQFPLGCALPAVAAHRCCRCAVSPPSGWGRTWQELCLSEEQLLSLSSHFGAVRWILSLSDTILRPRAGCDDDEDDDDAPMSRSLPTLQDTAAPGRGLARSCFPRALTGLLFLLPFLWSLREKSQSLQKCPLVKEGMLRNAQTSEV